jgi:ABC-type antimicrobial peptide transport system permease subunit
MGIGLLAGRDFVSGDVKVPVALINKTMAARLFGQENPIGQHVRQGGEDGKGQVFEVIGIVGDSKAVTIGEEQRACIFRYFPSDFSETISLLGTTVVLRSRSDPARLMTEVRRAVETVDRDMAVFGMQPMTEHVGKALMLPRICAVLFGVFGGIGLVLAAVGLYGVVNYSVRSRTREIGIRLALGGRPAAVAGAMARQGLLVVGVGLVIGLGLALALSRSLAALLWGITPTDLVTFVGVPLVLVVVAAAAVLTPALRAARMSPMAALRWE